MWCRMLCLMLEEVVEVMNCFECDEELLFIELVC